MASLIEVVLSYQYAGQQCQNVWTYESDSEVDYTSESEWLLSSMGFIPDEGDAFPGGTVFSALRTLVSEQVSFVSAYARDIYSVNDFYEILWSPRPVGLAGAFGMSPVLAYGFRTNRVKTNIRRGTKRFPGIPVAWNTTGGGFSPEATTAMNTLALRMSADLTFTAGVTEIGFTPVVAGKQRYDPDTGLPSATGRAYRYYPTYDEQTDYLARGVEWQPYDRQRTQNSRQYSRGR